RRRDHHLADRPGHHQHRRGGRAAADHRAAVAVHLRRRLRAGRDAGRDRPAGVVRPRRTGCVACPARPSPRPVGATTLGAATAVAAHPAQGGADDGGETVMAGDLRSVVLAGGGTGGHVYPLLAFADCLRRHDPDLRITCLGTTRGLENEIIPPRGYDLRLVPAHQLPRSVNLNLVRTPDRMWRAARATRAVLDEVAAQVVVGFGGYVAGPAGIQVLHIMGARNEPVEIPPDLPVPYVTTKFLSEMELGYAAADLALCRGGAMTCAETAAVGVPAIYVPLPYGNGEQRRNALPVVEAGGGLLVDDSELTPAWIEQTVVPLLRDPARVAAMSAAAAGYGRRDGDEALRA